jgi:2-oxoglutarate ferredoxin oxidoreductase subunit alpha
MKDLSIVLCGEAGQGIQTVEKLFIRIIKKTGFNVFSTKEYMSRVRGGSNSIEIRISTKSISAYIDRIDILVPLNKYAIRHIQNRISKNTLIIGEGKNIITKKISKKIPFPITKTAEEIGSKIYSNTVAVGILSSIFNVNKKILKEVILEYFQNKNKNIINKNIIAAERGYDLFKDLLKKDKINFRLIKPKSENDKILLNGAESIGLGAIAGGCNFISSYPMSPSTGVLTFLSKNSEEFNIISEQAEDEISAINMVIGAWYAGARGMVTTSGGGYALMTEGVSLAGMIESPVVIHLAQRPAPATGLPTRTEQGDLEHALYSSHGEFPKIIYSPATLEDGFYLTQKAFNLSDKYQTPAYILTDQYFIDSFYGVKDLDINKIRKKNHFIKTSKNYKRYKLTKNGISPRGIPGYGSGLVCVDSDEHDEFGRITEDMNTRIKMVEKRLKKYLEIKKEIIPPELIAEKDYKFLVIGWGSTYHIIKEALDNIGNKKIAHLHFKQVYPLYDDITKFLNKSEKTIIIENNATSQFSKLIRQQTGIEIKNKILQYNGLPFSVETIAKEIQKIIGDKQ